MDEYISKQKVLDYLNGYLHSLGEGGADTLLFDRGQRRALINSIQDISTIKAVDVQPVKHGRWIKHRIDDPKSILYGAVKDTTCSVCGKSTPYNTECCMHCGARMDGENNGKD